MKFGEYMFTSKINRVTKMVAKSDLSGHVQQCRFLCGSAALPVLLCGALLFFPIHSDPTVVLLLSLFSSSPVTMRSPFLSRAHGVTAAARSATALPRCPWVSSCSSAPKGYGSWPDPFSPFLSIPRGQSR
jgi:hypothetical protein